MKKIAVSLLVLMISCMVLAQTGDDSDGTNPDKAQILRDMGLEPYGPDSIAASTLVMTGLVQNDTVVDLTMTATNNSGDLEDLDRITVEFPAGWTISAIGYSDLGGIVSNPDTAGVGTNVATWTNTGGLCSGFGFLGSGGGQIELTVTVDTGAAMAGTIPVGWMMEGDQWGAEPWVLCSTSSACMYDACYSAAAPPQVAPGDDLLLDFEIMVPTLGQWGLIAFVALLGIVALFVARKKMM